MNKQRIVLASGSAIRADILSGAGLTFDIARPDVDEDAIKAQSAAKELTLEETALALAEAKALAEPHEPESLVIGSDQILEFQGAAYDKPKSMDEARRRLLDMAGASHTLINGVVVARGGKIIWRNLDRPRLYMRELAEQEVDAYLDASSPDILKSVGAYQVEKLGARLFERIEGDHFAVLGLSLYPLLAFLRSEGAIAF